MINGKVYDYEAIKTQLPTGMVLLMESISYSDKKDDEVITGVNSLPVGIGRGEYTGECEIEMALAEYDKLNAYSKNQGGFYNMPPIPIIVTYGHANQEKITDKLKVHLTERSFDRSKGDKNLNVTIKGALTEPLETNGVVAYVADRN